MAEYIEREAAKKAFYNGHTVQSLCERGANTLGEAFSIILDEVPAADVRPVVRAKWEDVHIDRPEIADIEVASMFCPNCNRWYNKVYHYGNPIEFVNFCSFCGADMGAVET